MKWMSMILALALLLMEGGECQQQRGRRIRVRGRRIRPSAGSTAAAPTQDTSNSAAGCPEPEGLQLYPDPNTCHAFYQCANGTLTYEVKGNSAQDLGPIINGGGHSIQDQSNGG